MKTMPVIPPRNLNPTASLFAAILISSFIFHPSSFAQPTTFTYQGRLVEGTNAATGNYDLSFTLYDAVTGGNTVGSTVNAFGTPVANGLFMALLDFGPGAFDGSLRYLEMAVRPTGSTNAFATVAPRQFVSSAPYAMQAGTASALRGTLADSQLSANIPRLNGTNTFTGTVNLNPATGAPFTTTSTKKIANLNADLLDGLDSTSFWKTTGNLATSPTTNFLGTLDNSPLELRANNQTVMRLDTSGNVGIGTVNPTAKLHVLDPAGANVLIGGSSSAVTDRLTLTDSEYGIRRPANQETLQFDSASRFIWAVAGAEKVRIDGAGNVGIGTTSPSAKLEVAGQILASTSSNPGLGIFLKSAVGPASYSWMIAAQEHVDGGLEVTPSTAPGSTTFETPVMTVKASGNVGILNANPTRTLHAGSTTSAGPSGHVRIAVDSPPENDPGFEWLTSGSLAWSLYRPDNSTDLRLYEPAVGDRVTFKSNGNVGIGTTSPSAKLHVSDYAAGANLLVGSGNSAVADRLTLFSGDYGLQRPANQATLQFDSASRFVWAVAGSEKMRIEASGNVGIGTTDPGNYRLAVAGGIKAVNNNIYDSQIHIYSPTVTSNSVTFCKALDLYAIDYNIPSGVADSGYRIGLGVQAYVLDSDFQGSLERQYGIWARHGSHSVSGGTINNSYGVYIDTLTTGSTTFGNLYGLYQNSSAAVNYFAGKVGIGTTTPTSALQVVGTVTATAFNPPSDRNLKENFTEVSPVEVLEKVAILPMSRWNFKGDASTPHLGPMAQDFHAAFGLGTDDKHIATVDADGVALAAIQGLNEKVESGKQKAEIRIEGLEQRLEQKETEITELKARLADLEKLVTSIANRGAGQ